MLKRLLLVETNVGSNSSRVYRELFDKIANRDDRWSFLEFLEGLELNDLWFGFNEWAPIEKGDRERIRNTEDWSIWYDELGMISLRQQEGIIEYPDLADRALEPSDSFSRLISSESTPKDLDIALLQAWPSFRRNWPQTARRLRTRPLKSRAVVETMDPCEPQRPQRTAFLSR